MWILVFFFFLSHSWYFPDICAIQIDLESVKGKICSTKYIKGTPHEVSMIAFIITGPDGVLSQISPPFPTPNTSLSSIHWICPKILKCNRCPITPGEPMCTMNSHFSVLCASHLGPINQENHPVSSAHHLFPWNPDASSSDLGAQWSLWHLANELMTLLSSHVGYLSFSLQFSSHRTWQPHTNTHTSKHYGMRYLLVWPNSLFVFSHTILQENPNFLAKPINLLSRTWFLQVFKEALRHKCRWSESLWDINVYHK